MVDKLTDKHEQRGQLRSLLLANSHTVSVLPIVLGNTGSVYKANANVLRALGVNHATREHLLKALSCPRGHLDAQDYQNTTTT